MKNLPLDFNWKYYVKFNNLEINSFIKAKYHYLNIGFKKNLLYKENLEIVSNSFDNNNNKIVDFKENLNTNKIIINSTDNYDLKKNDFKIKTIKDLDKIYVLNLENEKWKYDIIFKKSQEMGFEKLLERFIGINGQDERELFKIKHQEYINSLSNIKKKYYKKDLNNGFPKLGLFRSYGAFGCLLSNIKILEDAIKNNYENIIIFQDDIYFHKNFYNLINEFLEKHNKFTAIYLGYSQHKSHTNQIDLKTAGLFGIILNKRCFKLILNEFRKFKNPADVCVPKILIEYFKDSIYKCNPILIIPDVTDSKTSSKRDMIEHSKKMNWDLNNFDIINYKNFGDKTLEILQIIN
jgi:hypothetical protein